MKKLNAKGFTLIELLAVITIMGVLMIVAIPTVSRTIENTRRDTFLDTAKQYVNGVKTMWLSDSLECPASTEAASRTIASALPDGTYYVRIKTKLDEGETSGSGSQYPVILESGGKSSWSSRDLQGYVKIVVSGAGTGTAGTKYYIALSDGIHGISSSTANSVEYLNLKRGNVATDSIKYGTGEAVELPSDALVCYEY